MKDIFPPSVTPAEAQLLRRGRGEGLATAALALGALSFIQLLGMEKALLAIVLAALALRSVPSQQLRRRALAAIALGALYLAVALTTLFLYQDQLQELIGLLQGLG